MPPQAPCHGKNLRAGRYSETGQAYLITSVTNQRRKIFTNWQTGRLLALEFHTPEMMTRAKSLAWVIMPDHFHWLLSLQEHADLPAILQRVKSRSAIALNMLLRQEGQQIWQKGYHDHAVRRDEDIIALARYVVANPLRAGLVTKINDYPLWDAVWLP
jgi:REP element-mobilizing transposase RayT